MVAQVHKIYFVIFGKNYKEIPVPDKVKEIEQITNFSA
jgi:hypothetical protein